MPSGGLVDLDDQLPIFCGPAIRHQLTSTEFVSGEYFIDISVYCAQHFTITTTKRQKFISVSHGSIAKDIRQHFGIHSGIDWGSKTTLEHSEIFKNDNGSRASPIAVEESVCAVCGYEIKDQFVLRVMSDSFHECCLRCVACNQNLSNNSTCFSKDGRLYCREDHSMSITFNASA
ncbi:LIM domain protein [Dictyocaulus viviparus]|uniref:LIM domain protein n=1 Tax=Dictyocaulus viviparus TaxID=29172 RepID=A0A0D8XMZ0_DICVI|nr:LIM domain protein [Dictyocaulus viviparus]